MEKIMEFQDVIHYHFREERLLRQALTHSSYANEHRMNKLYNYERLEFLGDAVLEIVTSEFLYRNYPDWPEGRMTKVRSSIVCEPTLAFCTRRMSLGQYLFLGKGEEQTGGRRRSSVLSDVIEAVIGAVYLDGGMEPAEEFIDRFILYDIEHMQLFYDSKTILQEIVQGGGMGELVYLPVEESGPDHDKSYVTQACINGRPLGLGEGHTKKAAEQEAAYQTILLLGGTDVLKVD